MGIWRVLKGEVICDNCQKVIATCEFDANDEVNLERLHLWCLDCRKPKTKETEEIEAVIEEVEHATRS